MLARIALVCLVVATAPVVAGPAVEIHASCAADVATDPTHVRTLKSELAHAMANATAAHAVDVTLVKLDTSSASQGEVIVRAEVRAFVSEPNGKVKWAASARATARGPAKDRSLVQRDAVTAVAQEIAKTIQKGR
ncbi:MAG TPA: hypothetical protein VMZ53_16105 [Kofleriaceae bacterium]|nr:hypothetical protein [Kofleriaceae bacterium]